MQIRFNKENLEEKQVDEVLQNISKMLSEKKMGMQAIFQYLPTGITPALYFDKEPEKEEKKQEEE